MSNWTSFLVKTSLSSSLVEECSSAVSGKAKATLAAQLGASIDSAADLKNLQAAVKRLKGVLPSTSLEALNEEVREIAADAKWAKTGRGRYILTINQWAEPFFAEFRSRSEFLEVVIGGHLKREVVFVAGVVPSEALFHELLAYVQSKNPPYKMMTNVRIGSAEGPKATA